MKDALGHGSDSRGGGEAQVHGIAAAHGIDTGHILQAAQAASAALARGDFPLADALRRANGLPGGDADKPGWRPAKGTEKQYADAIKSRDAITANLLRHSDPATWSRK